MAASHPDSSNNKNLTTKSEKNRISQILTEFGLDPTDYIFDSSSQDQISDHPSAFSKYSPPKQTLITSGRPITYVQYPPPPRPVVNRQASRSKTGTPHDMSEHSNTPRRTPPLPPSSPHTLPHQHDGNLSAEHYLRHIDSQENPPVKVVKPSTQNVVYKKEIRIRYLQPPTPPPPAPIIIREKHIPPNPPESPLLIRERKPEPRTPPPLTIRERPPSPPPLLEPYVVEKPIPPPPPQPRQIIIERLPTPPPKPRTVIFEKWLPYKKVKRPILLQKAPPPPPVQPTRNVVIEYEPLKAYTVRRVIEEGIFRVDPSLYSNYHEQHADGNVRIVDRIDDLPPPSEELMRELKSYNENPPIEPSKSIEQLINISRTSNIPTNQRQPVPSSPHNSSIPSPIDGYYRQTQRQTPHDSPMQLKSNNIY